MNGETYTTLTGWEVCCVIVVFAVTYNPFLTFLMLFSAGAVTIGANPLFVYGFFLIATGRPSDALKPSLMAVGLAALAWLVTGSHLLIGYYLWLASLITLTAAAWVGEAMHRRFDQPGGVSAKDESRGTGSTDGA